jgi:hypothetical protein
MKRSRIKLQGLGVFVGVLFCLSLFMPSNTHATLVGYWNFDEKELVSFKEMLMANSIQVDAMAQLLIEYKGRSKNETIKRSVENCDTLN